MPGTSVWADPDRVCDTVLKATALPLHVQAEADDATWLATWRAADEHASAAIDKRLEGSALSEPATARALSAAHGPVVLASSMPIRDCESFWPVSEHPPRTYSNRGANGIDGTIATALGVAAGTGERPTLLIGDVALTHDLGGLAAGSRLGLPLTIVLIDNGGGGIFDFLPVGDAAPDGYEEHVATRPGLDFATLARGAGAGHAVATDLGHVSSLLSSCAEQDGVFVIEVRGDRAANVALHRRVADDVIAALGG